MSSLARLRRATVPYALSGPGVAFLVIFFCVPLLYLVQTALQSGSLAQGYTFSWAWGNFSDGLIAYDAQLVRSFLYAGAATLLALIGLYPLVYWIALRAGRWRTFLLICLVAPFFVTYLVRTLAWQTILADDGVVAGVLRAVHVIGPEGSLLATPVAVITGLSYNYAPLLALPLYASLERLDLRLLDASSDLYADRARSFLLVTLPLSAPGILAGCLLMFIPAAGDYVNAALLGSPDQTMIGNVIQSKFLNVADYPAASALSCVLMVIIVAAVMAWVRALGTERLTG